MACTRVIIVNDVCMYKLPTYLHCETVSIPNLPCRCCSIRSRGCRPAAKDAPRRREVAAAALGGDAGEAGPAKPHWVDRTCRAEFATRSPAGEEETGATHWRCCCCCCRRSRRRGCMPDPRLHRAWLASRPAIGDRHALCTSWLDGCSTRLLPDRLWPFSWFPPSSSIEMRKWHLMKVLSLSLFVLVHSWGGGHDVFMSIDEHNIRLQRRLGIDFLTLPIPTPSTRRHPLLPTLSLSPDSFVGRYKRSRSIEPTLPVRMSPPPPPTHKELENHSPLYIRDDLIIKFQARWSQLVSTALLPRCRK